MTKETVVKQFFWDLLENLGEDYESDSEYSSYDKEENNLILLDLFFAGLLKIGWDHKTGSLILETLEEPLRPLGEK